MDKYKSGTYVNLASRLDHGFQNLRSQFTLHVNKAFGKEPKQTPTHYLSQKELKELVKNRSFGLQLRDLRNASMPFPRPIYEQLHNGGIVENFGNKVSYYPPSAGINFRFHTKAISEIQYIVMNITGNRYDGYALIGPEEEFKFTASSSILTLNRTNSYNNISLTHHVMNVDMQKHNQHFLFQDRRDYAEFDKTARWEEIAKEANAEPHEITSFSNSESARADTHQPPAMRSFFELKDGAESSSSVRSTPVIS